MKKDNAIKKVLERSDTTLPFDFETRTMKRIQKVTERRSKRTFVLQLFLVSTISVAMIFVVYYVLDTKLEADLGFGRILLVVSKVRSDSFELYIAFLALVLLFADALLRRKYKARNNNSM